jgi:probable F420-dependent oxidoreductase
MPDMGAHDGRVRYGISIFATDLSIAITDLAREAEARGFESLWVPEHTHIPVSRRTPPPTGDAELPEQYRRCLDPFVALTAAATVTERLRVGTGICLVAQHDPIATAKAVASLDLVSGGRFSFGVGYGWNEDEMEAHGVVYGERRAIAREHVLAMQALWREDEATFTGDHVQLAPSWSWPKPVQKPWPPVLVGGAAGPKLFAHIAEFADGWIPIGGAGMTEALPRLRDAVGAAGRDPSTLQIIPFGSVPNPGKLEHFRSIGVTEVVFMLPSAPRDVVLPILDRQAAHLGNR